MRPPTRHTARREEHLTGRVLAPEATRPQLFSDAEIQRAIDHHRRALEALRDRSTFTGIRHATAEHLLERLGRDLHRLEAELVRRGGAEGPGRATPLPAPGEVN